MPVPPVSAPLAAVLCAILWAPPARAADHPDSIGRGTFAAGLSYPGVGLRYFVTDRFPLELKAQAAPGVTLAGLRGYRFFSPLAGVYPLAGLEADYVAFKGDRAKGNGFAGQVFVGGERFLFNRLSIQVDFGPAYIHLPNRTGGVSVSGIEYVLNFGINFYFGAWRRDSYAAPSRSREATPDPWAGWKAEEEPAPKPKKSKSKPGAKPRPRSPYEY